MLVTNQFHDHAVWLALRYMYGGGSRGLFAPRWDFLSLSLLLLGIGSFLFHASLQSVWEFADELSMLGLTWSMLQSSLTTRQSLAAARRTNVLLAVAFLGFSAFHIYTANIIYHEIAFLSAMSLVIVQSQYAFMYMKPSFPPAMARDWNIRTWQAIGIASFGYVLWNIDLEMCGALRGWRNQIGLPWAWLLELHGWWHILTAIGADRAMNVAREVREEVEREKRFQARKQEDSEAKLN
jgi:dihydroceramidase